MLAGTSRLHSDASYMMRQNFYALGLRTVLVATDAIQCMNAILGMAAWAVQDTKTLIVIYSLLTVSTSRHKSGPNTKSSSCNILCFSVVTAVLSDRLFTISRMYNLVVTVCFVTAVCGISWHVTQEIA